MTQAETAQQNHVWRFFRAGGFDQVRLDSGDDIAALATLDLIDLDHDGCGRRRGGNRQTGCIDEPRAGSDSA
ncbi:MAG TPA: hypothetical protein VN832_03980 [Stellaceae bacterium]|nr:hypothetical protein [Stellaceae bacterium]